MENSSFGRRGFLGQASALASLFAVASSLACRRPGPAPARFTGDPTEISATAAVAAMRNGKITAEAYATALLDRAERLQRLNAFRVLNRDQVLASARAADKSRAAGGPLGLLHGLPIPVKDSVNTAAYPTSNGTRALEQFRPKTDAAVLGPLLAQGAYVMGKTNLHELSIGRSTFFAPCCGHPGLVLAAGRGASGLPIGIEFDGLAGTDRQLLALGLALEKVLEPIPPPTV